MTEFNTSLSVGKIVEHEVCEVIRKKYPKAYVVDGYEKRWDIFIQEKNEGVEVKLDEMSNYTGNLVVEIEFDVHPSALETTEASWWVFVDKDNYFWVKPDVLKYIIKEAELRPATFTGKGDQLEKRAYLLKKDILANSTYVHVTERKK